MYCTVGNGKPYFSGKCKLETGIGFNGPERMKASVIPMPEPRNTELRPQEPSMIDEPAGVP